MMKGYWSNLGGFSKLMVLLLMILTSTIVLSAVSLLIALPFMDGFSLLDPGNSHLSMGAIKYFQVVQSFSVFIIPGLLAGYLFWGHPTRGIGFSKTSTLPALLSIIIIVACQPLASYLGVFNSQMQLPAFLEGIESWMKQAEENANTLIFQFLDTENPRQVALNIIIIAILPALGEEIIFRGCLLPISTQWLKNKHIAVWFTAFIFSAIHLQFFTFLPRFFLGILLGYLMIWGKSLWYPITAHFTNNLMALIIFYYYRLTQPDINPLEPTSGQLSIWWLITATSALTLLLVTFYRRQKST